MPYYAQLASDNHVQAVVESDSVPDFSGTQFEISSPSADILGRFYDSASNSFYYSKVTPDMTKPVDMTGITFNIVTGG